MTNTLETAILQVAKYLSVLEGMRKIGERPPETINDFPAFVCYASAGVWEFGAAQDKKGLHTIAIEIHVARKDLPKDIQAAMRWSDVVPNLLFYKLLYDNKWNGTIDTFKRITYTFGGLGWGDAATLGFRFRVEDVKMLSEVTA